MGWWVHVCVSMFVVDVGGYMLCQYVGGLVGTCVSGWVGCGYMCQWVGELVGTCLCQYVDGLVGTCLC